MIVENLYENVLIEPINQGANRLKIISGYATSAMASRHIEDINSLSKDVDISLLIGMCSKDGLSISNHLGFKSIMDSEYSSKFSCSYIHEKPQVHSKVYIWYKDDIFYRSYIGSANYTQDAFSRNQREILSISEDIGINKYYNELEKQSIYCSHPETETLIKIYNDRDYYRVHINEEVVGQKSDVRTSGDELENIKVSLLTRSGGIQRNGGLNWGQRDGREPNQAYIQLPPNIYKSDFFPPKPKHFTVATDDSKILICTRAQKDEVGHAIHTPHNNSFLGEYFRNRMGLPNGAFVRKEDLENYGRTDVTFYKVDEENYYMNFSV